MFSCGVGCVVKFNMVFTKLTFFKVVYYEKMFDITGLVSFHTFSIS